KSFVLFGMRKRGFEPLRYCYRQPLKLVRLPFRHFRVRGSVRVRLQPDTTYYFGGVVGVGGGVASAPLGTAGGPGVPLTSEPGPRCPMIASASAPSMNNTAKIVVAFDSTVAPPRAPNAVWLLPPPNALAMSPPFPCCSRMTSSSTKQTMTYSVESR